VVLLSGEAGIGKSRLTAALLERLAPEAHSRLRYFCSPQHTDSAFYPIIGQMERAAGLAHGRHAASKARQARRAARADFDLKTQRGALCRDAVPDVRRDERVAENAIDHGADITPR
jgi:predicted ATPase